MSVSEMSGKLQSVGIEILSRKLRWADVVDEEQHDTRPTTKECETDPDQTVGSEEGCWNSVLDPALALTCSNSWLTAFLQTSALVLYSQFVIHLSRQVSLYFLALGGIAPVAL